MRQCAIDKHVKLAWRKGRPVFIGGQRLGHNDGQPILLAIELRQIDRDIVVFQVHMGKRVRPQHVTQIGGGVCPQCLAVTE